MKNFFARKWPYIFVILYILFPIDLIPDALPILGNVDDSVLLIASLLKEYIEYRKEKNTGV